MELQKIQLTYCLGKVIDQTQKIFLQKRNQLIFLHLFLQKSAHTHVSCIRRGFALHIVNPSPNFIQCMYVPSFLCAPVEIVQSGYMSTGNSPHKFFFFAGVPLDPQQTENDPKKFMTQSSPMGPFRFFIFNSAMR